MSEFSELVKRFEKIRSYVRDFYIYGFKTREDYRQKSSRTYDNERRRMESWFSGYIREEYRPDRKKSVSITVDSNRIAVNPLYQAWKSKSFTSNDIMLHFFLLDLLRDGIARDVEAVTDGIYESYQALFDSQMVRRKLAEYVQEGLLTVSQEGRKHVYALSRDISIDDAGVSTKPPAGSSPAAGELSPGDAVFASLADAVCFFQGAAPFGFVGSTILDSFRISNDRFRFRHDFLVHTLEDEILLPLLTAIRENREIQLTVRSFRSTVQRDILCTPLKILVSTQTGRRYVCVHKTVSRRLVSYRLDSIQSIQLLETDANARKHHEAYERNAPAAWGVTFGTSRSPETICLQVLLNEETEKHIIHRLEREGRGGTVTRLEPGIYQYQTDCWDASEMIPWIRTFTGRIRSFTCSNKAVEHRFWDDMRRMRELYHEE